VTGKDGGGDGQQGDEDNQDSRNGLVDRFRLGIQPEPDRTDRCEG